MTPPDILASIAATPEWFPHMLDAQGERVTLLRMGEQDYRQASFLDQRILTPASQTQVVRWEDLGASLPAAARRDLQFIFHIGNVGSTLISRLLGELETVFALREPLLLRSFSELLARWSREEAASRIDVLRTLLSRTFHPRQRGIVKATSFTSEIAAQLIPPASKSLFLFASPQAYVENILAGENSRKTAELLAPSRLQRLQRRCGGLALDLEAMPIARKAALGWACEMSSLEANAATLPDDSVMWLDFDRFLTDRPRHFAAIAAHFGHAVDEAAARAIAEGPLMRRYSKALEYEYSPQLRRDILAEARWLHGPAIRDALGWLNALASRYPAVAQAIRRAQKEA
ncbi:MAG: hypothetical protein M3177_10670 [Pseudomonadota bacterium]|nr:hypothetical protein [Pseudomonadota bacterium]